MLMRDAEYLLADGPAFALMSQIAIRAKRTSGNYAINGNVIHLEAGQALIGDYRKCGISEQNYRTAKKRLQKLGLVTFQATNKGTIATLLNSMVYDINAVGGNEQCDEQGSEQNNRQATNGVTTNKNKRKKKVKEGKKENTDLQVSVLNCKRNGKTIPAKQYGGYVFLTECEHLQMVEEWGETFTMEAINQYDLKLPNSPAMMKHTDHNRAIRDYVKRGFICSGKIPVPVKNQEIIRDYHVPQEEMATLEDIEEMMNSAMPKLTRNYKGPVQLMPLNKYDKPEKDAGAGFGAPEKQ